NYTKEQDDLESVINWVVNTENYKNEINSSSIALIGHSRGGGTVLLKANENDKITKVITLAGVSDYKSRFPTGEILEQWKKDGVAYITNGRTNQQMPHFYQFYENFVANEEKLNVKKATENLAIPHLIIHGDNDTSVTLAEAENLKKWNADATLAIIENTDHVFNTSHPWEKENIPEEFQKIISLSIDFLK
ncbi:prolyl oligopeptidase family serine peptidase, partial [Polaribacter sp.]|nr:prolyl oligopeptidase family serine peptidase [Polaribacter sp.]